MIRHHQSDRLRVGGVGSGRQFENDQGVTDVSKLSPKAMLCANWKTALQLAGITDSSFERRAELAA